MYCNVLAKHTCCLFPHLTVKSNSGRCILWRAYLTYNLNFLQYNFSISALKLSPFGCQQHIFMFDHDLIWQFGLYKIQHDELTPPQLGLGLGLENHRQTEAVHTSPLETMCITKLKQIKLCCKCRKLEENIFPMRKKCRLSIYFFRPSSCTTCLNMEKQGVRDTIWSFPMNICRKQA